MAKKTMRGPKKPPSKKQETSWGQVGRNILKTMLWADSSEGRKYGKAVNDDKVNKYKDTAGDSLDENLFEFIEPTGMLSWDDVGRSVQENGLFSRDTFIEGAGAVPFVKYLSKVGRAADYMSTYNKQAGIFGKTVSMAPKLTDTAEDFLNVLNSIGWSEPKNGISTGPYSEADALESMGQGPAKYLTGGYIGNRYMDNPSEVLMENHRNRAQAEYEAASGALPQILDVAAPIVGSLASSFSAGQQAKFANFTPNTGGKMADGLKVGLQDPYATQPLPEIPMPEFGNNTPSGDRLSQFDFLHTPAPTAREGWRPNFYDGTTETHLYESTDYDDVSMAYPGIAQNPITKEFFEPTDPVDHARATGTGTLGSPLSARSFASGEWKNFYDSDGSVLNTEVAKRNQRFKPQFATGGVIDWDTAAMMYPQDPPVKGNKPVLETGEVGTGNVPFGQGTELGEGANLIGKGFQGNMKDVFMDASNKKLIKQYQDFYNANPNCLGSAMDCNQQIAKHLGLKSLRTIKANHGNEERYRIADKSKFETEYKDNGSTDSWEYYNYMLGEGLATSMLDKSQPLKYKRGSHFPEGLDLYSIPLGAVIGQGNSKGTYTQGDGTRHSWTVVGFDKKDRMPMVFDNGKLRRLDDFDKAVLSHAKHKVNEIIVPNEYQGLTSQYFLDNIGAREKAAGFGTKVKLPTNYPSVRSIEKGANKYKDDIAFEYGLDKQDIDLLIQTLPGLAYQETKINNFAGTSGSIGVDSTFGNAFLKPFAKDLKNHKILMDNEGKEGVALQPYEMELMAYWKHPDPDSEEFKAEYKRLEAENEGKKKPIDKNTDKSSRGPFSIKELSNFAKEKLAIRDRDLNNALSRKSELEHGAGAALDHLASTYSAMKRLHPDYTPEQLRDLAIVGYNNNSKVRDGDFKEHYIKDPVLQDDYLGKVLGYSEDIARSKLSDEEIREAFKNNSKANRKKMRQKMKESRATGGFTGSSDVEVEGQEMFELPNGITGKFEGPSHENGGIDVTLPKGTEVYSKRIKGPDGKTMAKRKEHRDNTLKKIEQGLSKNPLDKLLAQTYARTKQALELADQEDLAFMEQARQQQETMASGGYVGVPKSKYDLGGEANINMINGNNYLIGDIYNRLLDPTADPDSLEGNISLGEASIISAPKNKPIEPSSIVKAGLQLGGEIPMNTPPKAQPIPNPQSHTPPEEEGATGGGFKMPKIGLTPGDMFGIASNVMKANRAHRDTLNEIATSLPNINSYDGYGQDALATLNNNAGLLQQMYDLSTQSLQGRTQAAMAQSRNSARGVNQMRALDLANIQAANQAQNQLDAQHASQVITNNNAIANQQNAIDQTVMRGDEAKRLADQQDHGQDHMNLQQTRQAMIDATVGQTGEVLNKVRNRDLMSKLISARFGNFETDAFGNITSIPEGAPVTQEQELESRGLTEEYNTRVARGEDVELRNGKLYKKGTNEIVAEGGKTDIEKRIDERNYSKHYEKGLGIPDISAGVRYSPGDIKMPSKFYKGIKASDVQGYLQAHSSEFGDLDLTTEQGVAQLQQQIGAPIDGKFGTDTKKALEDRYKDAKNFGGYQASLTKKEYQDLEDLLVGSAPIVNSIFDKAKEIYGDFTPEDFYKDAELMDEAKRSILLGGITHADELYDKYKDSMGDLTKEELRKISLLSPEALVEDGGKLTVDLDRRAPGSNYTLGYKVRGTKHKKRFAKKD